MEVRRPSTVSMPLVGAADSKHSPGQHPPPSIQGGPAAQVPVPVQLQGSGEHVLWVLADHMVGDMRDLALRMEHLASPGNACQLMRRNPGTVAMAATVVLLGGGLTLAGLAITGRL